jgi:hypothetical protein
LVKGSLYLIEEEAILLNYLWIFFGAKSSDFRRNVGERIGVSAYGRVGVGRVTWPDAGR